MRIFDNTKTGVNPMTSRAWTSRLCGALLIAGSVWLAGPAAAQHGEMLDIIERLEQIERDIADLHLQAGRPNGAASGFRATPGVAGQAQTASAAGGPAVARLLVRVDQLESELTRLTGEFERLQYRYERLQTIVNQVARNGGAPAGGAVAPVDPQNPSFTSQTRLSPSFGAAEADPYAPAGDGQSQDAPFGITGQAQTPAGDPDFGAPQTESQPDAGAGSQIPRRLTPGVAMPDEGVAVVAGPSGDPRADFKSARDLLLKGEFAGAETAFRSFVETYPDSDFAGEAQYWIGESLFVRELYTAAAEAYLATARDYPDSTRAADSLLKLALTFERLGERKAACDTLRQLSRKYPDASEPIKRNLKKARAEFSCA